jgi:hypothetical protein
MPIELIFKFAIGLLVLAALAAFNDANEYLRPYVWGGPVVFFGHITVLGCLFPYPGVGGFVKMVMTAPVSMLVAFCLWKML